MDNKIKVIDSFTGSGKAQPLYSKILTKDGFRQIIELQVGDRVFGEDGQLHDLIGIFPQGKQEIYEIEFSDRTTTRSTEDHLWNIKKYDGTFKTIPLKEILKRGLFSAEGDKKRWKFCIPITKPINFSISPELKIPPYVMGLLIGDGCFQKNGSILFSNSEKDILDKIELLMPEYHLVKIDSSKKRCDYRVIPNEIIFDNREIRNHLIYNLKKYGLLGKKSFDKFIPKEYIYNSIENRLEILRGLMDSDGEVINSQYIFSTTSKKLLENIVFIIQSFGGTATISVRHTKYSYKGEKRNGRKSYRIYFKLPKEILPFSSNKHCSKYKKGVVAPHRSIRKITKIGFEECVCIKTSNPSSLYLTDNMIVTHNTSWAIDYINNLHEDTRILYITPFIKECDRIVSSCSQRKFIQPSRRSGKGRKMTHLIDLVMNGENIVSTHALFSNIDDHLLDALRANDYILFLDETMSVVENFDLYDESKMINIEKEELVKQDVQSLKDKGYLKINPDYSVSWVSDDHLGKYKTLKELADRKLLYFINDSLLIWTFPIEVFQSNIFSEIYLLTYLFDYQIQSLYYSYFDIEYEFYHIEEINGKYTLLETKDNKNEIHWKKSLQPLIDIIDVPKLNKIGGVYQDNHNRMIKTSLSKNWFERNPELVDKLGHNVVNFFKHYTETKSHQRMWTSFKSHVPQLKRRNLSDKQWLEITCRATNDYGDRVALAYCVNRYSNPFFQHFFNKRNVRINEDHFALSEMQQWIWRSAIRNGHPISLYIPSERMRTLFIKWLNDEEIVF